MSVYSNPSEFLKDITEKLYSDLSQIQQMHIYWAQRPERHLVRSRGDAGPCACPEPLLCKGEKHPPGLTHAKHRAL